MQTLQEMLREAAEDVGDSSIVSFRNNYVGRGMYGRQCVGITGSFNECMRLIGTVIKNMSMRLSATALQVADPRRTTTADDLGDVENMFDEHVSTLMDFMQDSMGMGAVLYWPELIPIMEENQEIELHDSFGDD